VYAHGNVPEDVASAPGPEAGQREGPCYTGAGGGEGGGSLHRAVRQERLTRLYPAARMSLKVVGIWTVPEQARKHSVSLLTVVATAT
jgi:hypothetical protein